MKLDIFGVKFDNHLANQLVRFFDRSFSDLNLFLLFWRCFNGNRNLEKKVSLNFWIPCRWCSIVHGSIRSVKTALINVDYHSKTTKYGWQNNLLLIIFNFDEKALVKEKISHEFLINFVVLLDIWSDISFVEEKVENFDWKFSFFSQQHYKWNERSHFINNMF